MSKASKIWIAVGVAGLAVLMSAGLWFCRPAYHRYKEKRSLARAREFLEQSDYRNALLSLQLALTMNSSNMTAARLMADVYDRAKSPTALAWRRRVAELSQTVEDKVLLAETALRVEKPPYAIAAETLDNIRFQGETNTTYHLVSAQLAMQLHRLDDAAAQFKAAAALEPTNRIHQLNFATVQLQSPDTKTAGAARRELAGLIQDPALGSEALRSLTADALIRNDLGPAEDYSKRLLEKPDATFEDRLRRLTVLSATKSREMGRLLAETERRCATNSAEVARLMFWMNAHDYSRPALEWLHSLPAAMRNTMPLPIVETDCYLALRDWAGLESRLNGQRWSDQDFLRLALLSRALREQRRNDMAGTLWRQAVSAAGRRNEFLVMLAQASGTWGWQAETEELLWSIVKRAPADEWALMSLLGRYQARGETVGLYQVFQLLLERHPKSLELKNNVATAGLLLNRDVTRSGELAREVYEAGRTNAMYVSTYAFALYAQSNPAAGLKLMQALPAAELRKPSIAAYYGVLLAAAGERERARPFFAEAEKAPLLPEERRLVAQAKGEGK